MSTSLTKGDLAWTSYLRTRIIM